MSRAMLVKFFGSISPISNDAASNLDEAKNQAESIRNQYRSGADLQGLEEELNTLALKAAIAMARIKIVREKLPSAYQIVYNANRLSETIEDPDGRVERLRQRTELPICELLSREELGAVRSRVMREQIMDSFYTPEELQVREVKRIFEGTDIERSMTGAYHRLAELWMKAEEVISCSYRIRDCLGKVAAVQLLGTLVG